MPLTQNQRHALQHLVREYHRDKNQVYAVVQQKGQHCNTNNVLGTNKYIDKLQKYQARSTTNRGF